MKPSHLEKKQSDANERSKHEKAELILNIFNIVNDGREFPVPQSGTRILGTGQLSSTPLFLRKSRLQRYKTQSKSSNSKNREHNEEGTNAVRSVHLRKMITEMQKKITVIALRHRFLSFQEISLNNSIILFDNFRIVE
jgi:hypothetical protein